MLGWVVVVVVVVVGMVVLVPVVVGPVVVYPGAGGTGSGAGVVDAAMESGEICGYQCSEGGWG